MPRFIHHIYALICGYFWLPCPLCGKPFGGHEWKDHNNHKQEIYVGDSSWQAVCPNCIEDAKKYNDVYYCRGGY